MDHGLVGRDCVGCRAKKRGVIFSDLNIHRDFTHRLKRLLEMTPGKVAQNR
jgi:hypothetical protein